IHALKTWRHYLLGREFEAHTDHRTLQHLFTQSNISARQARWMEILQEFNVNIVYKPGTHNIVADSLSRRPDRRINSVSTLSSDSLQEIREAYLDDIDFRDVYHALTRPAGAVPSSLRTHISRYSLVDGLLWYDKYRLCVPRLDQLRRNILHDNHDAPI